MNSISVEPIPRQALSVSVNGARFDFNICETKGVMSATVVMNNQVIIQNVRLTAGEFILPYRYEENGNFMFFNLGDEIIYYPRFGVSQHLNYFSPQDLAYLRGS